MTKDKHFEVIDYLRDMEIQINTDDGDYSLGVRNSHFHAFSWGLSIVGDVYLTKDSIKIEKKGIFRRKIRTKKAEKIFSVYITPIARSDSIECGFGKYYNNNTRKFIDKVHKNIVSEHNKIPKDEFLVYGLEKLHKRYTEIVKRADNDLAKVRQTCDAKIETKPVPELIALAE